ncbi:hypothetical protein IE81DRAFT_355632 [Ceraceosorus guamensis]|uniref:Uncharacterized protein n=1 Tax=Ceraceosorus guamensis TaxID=1522189 RepID=A0A316W366_9BASI|nr:hypothetical protein IE81DRAFT_355632 [Ceraceosorus guamensis]PWN43213.1 hypothetical protein IE81DRAFT_355632 [Ceraceosorus guamensis]
MRKEWRAKKHQRAALGETSPEAEETDQVAGSSSSVTSKQRSKQNASDRKAAEAAYTRIQKIASQHGLASRRQANQRKLEEETGSERVKAWAELESDLAKEAQARREALDEELAAVKKNEWAKLREELNAYEDTQKRALHQSLETQVKEANAKQGYLDQQRQQLCDAEQRLAQQQAACAEHQAHCEQSLATRDQELNAATSLQQQLANNFRQALDQQAREWETSLRSRQMALEGREAEYNRVLGAEPLVRQRDHELDERERQLAERERQAAQHRSPPTAESRTDIIEADMVPDFEIVEVRRAPRVEADVPRVKVEEDLDFEIVEPHTAPQTDGPDPRVKVEVDDMTGVHVRQESEQPQSSSPGSEEKRLRACLEEREEECDALRTQLWHNRSPVSRALAELQDHYCRLGHKARSDREWLDFARKENLDLQAMHAQCCINRVDELTEALAGGFGLQNSGSEAENDSSASQEAIPED